MGLCKDCAYFYETYNMLLNKYACDKFKRYVKANDSCPAFIAKPSGGSGCFLTSACVDYMGKEDDCEELTALRKFRDGYMRSTESGKALVDEYYEIAPKIVKNIDNSQSKELYYQYIYAVVKNCASLIAQEKYEETLAEYQKMVVTLKNQFAQNL